ncbi:MAG TPA: hypothetical protein VK530_10415 [Candidatus Acidoferrum sp.]|nr:hypothetical protein [Candidatus Acidoferrum sp.]
MAKRKWGWRRVLKITGLVFAAVLVVAFIPRRLDKPIDHQVVANYSVRDPAFRESVEHLVSAPLLEGNKVTPLINGEQIFPAMLDAIRRAERTITLENFIFRSGKLSAEWVPVLCERARAGVEVKMIMDSMGCSKLNQDELEQLEKAGVEFVKYNRTEWHNSCA